ncbi:hypothetical protein M1307_01700 [Patescibacteria group bacterium]|nr:hypothetical protein [Patescibacteria group bacterium]
MQVKGVPLHPHVYCSQLLPEPVHAYVGFPFAAQATGSHAARTLFEENKEKKKNNKNKIVENKNIFFTTLS